VHAYNYKCNLLYFRVAFCSVESVVLQEHRFRCCSDTLYTCRCEPKQIGTTQALDMHLYMWALGMHPYMSLQDATHCNTLQQIGTNLTLSRVFHVANGAMVHQCCIMRCSVLQCVAVCCSVLQYVAEGCSVLQFYLVE